MSIPRGMRAKQPIGNNALKSSLVHDLLKRQVFWKTRKTSSPSPSWRSKHPMSKTI
jgi:hypothetical protein